MAYYLGIDGGGSKTSCLLGDPASVLGAGRSSGSNPIRVGAEKAQEALADAIHQACGQAKIAPREITKTCVGVAGAARAETSELIRNILLGVVGGEIQVVGDMEIALAAASGTGPGVVVIAGTGSIAYGRNSSGRTARAGGWGFAISDEGSGQWIGRAAISTALRSEDEGNASKLLDAILQRWNLQGHEQLILKSNSMPPPDFATLMPVVQQSADGRDAAAQELLEEAGKVLAKIGNIVIGKLFEPYETVPVAMSGGVFEHSPPVRQSFYNHLRRPVSLVPHIVEPVNGALEIARGS